MALSITSEMKQLSSVERELSIVVPGAEVARELDRAYRELSQKVRIKGFRQGKVPRYVLEQYYKADTEQQVLERILGESFRAAVTQHALEPVANPQIQGAGELIAGMDFRYAAKVEVKPAIEIQQWKGLPLKKTRYEVTDADVARELEKLRERQAKVAPVEGREVVQQGDLVETNWSATVEGEPVKGLSGLSTIIAIGAGSFPYKEAEQALVGRAIGESVQADSRIPDDFRVEAARGKTAVFTLKILGLKHKTLPALDDEFAKDVSDEFETLAQLQEQVKGQLERLAEQKTSAETRDGAVAALIEKNPFELPNALIERQAEQIAAERLSRLPEKQAEMIWQAQGARLKEDAKPLATRQVRASLLLQELAKREGVVITDAEIEAHFEKIAADMGSDVQTVRKVYTKNRRLDELRFQLSTGRMLDRVIEEAVVEESTQPIG